MIQFLSFVSQVEGNAVRIHKMPGWVFGDVALLFDSPRSASVEAATDCYLWALHRRTFLKADYPLSECLTTLYPDIVYAHSLKTTMSTSSEYL